MEQIYNAITQQEVIIRRFGVILTAISSVYLALYIILEN
jgi:Na+/proline symporter